MSLVYADPDAPAAAADPDVEPIARRSSVLVDGAVSMDDARACGGVFKVAAAAGVVEVGGGMKLPPLPPVFAGAGGINEPDGMLMAGAGAGGMKEDLPPPLPVPLLVRFPRVASSCSAPSPGCAAPAEPVLVLPMSSVYKSAYRSSSSAMVASRKKRRRRREGRRKGRKEEGKEGRRPCSKPRLCEAAPPQGAAGQEWMAGVRT